MTGASADPAAALGARVLDVLTATFGQVLRRRGVAASPAELIEARRVLAALGGSDLDLLRAGLRAVTVKYAHERDGFEVAFDAFFGPGATAAEVVTGRRELTASGAPDALDLVEEDPLGVFADYNPRAAEVGDLVAAPEREQGFNPHRDDDDLSTASSRSTSSVQTGPDQGRRGVTYTIDLERAGTAVAGELTAQGSAPAVGAIDWDDPAAILAFLTAVDPRQIYSDGPGADLAGMTAAEIDRLVQAIAGFVAALAEQAAPTRTGPGNDQGPADPDAVPDAADLLRACHELLRRMRGAPRRVPRERGRGPLDVRNTVRRSMRTDGVPFHLVVRRPVPDRIRLVVIADVSLSVRSVTAFTLRLAQMLHRMAYRCRVIAFVDSGVDVTDRLLRSSGDGALAAVLAAPELELDATSDYGSVLAELNGRHAGLIDSRTSVLFVGDGRGNGRPPGLEELRRLRRRAHRIGWITPEPRRYWNQASCAMNDYAEIVDHVVTARDPAELADHVGELGHALS